MSVPGNVIYAILTCLGGNRRSWRAKSRFTSVYRSPYKIGFADARFSDRDDLT